MGNFEGPMYLVDGLQRVTAVMSFLQNKIKAFGKYRREFEGCIPDHAYFIVHINAMCDKNEILEWYLELNEGGVVHTKEELNKVRKLIKEYKE